MLFGHNTHYVRLSYHEYKGGVLVERRKLERVGCIGTGNPYNLMEANNTSHQIHI